MKGRMGGSMVAEELRFPHHYESSTFITGKTSGFTGLKSVQLSMMRKLVPLAGD